MTETYWEHRGADLQEFGVTLWKNLISACIAPSTAFGLCTPHSELCREVHSAYARTGVRRSRSPEKRIPPEGWVDEHNWPILICLLGQFRLLKFGQPVALRPRGRTRVLLQSLALRPMHSLPRETLLDCLWPNSPRSLAGQSLNSVVYSLHKSLGASIRGALPIVHDQESYRLNMEAGVGIDVACFDAAAEAGEQKARSGDLEAAAASFRRALGWYRGDLCVGEDVHGTIERERLRARYLNLLARLADYAHGNEDHAGCLHYALLLLSQDPCREDAHRLVMRCYVRQGGRSQAMHQYRLCERILTSEFDATPEPATRALFERIRLNPESV